MKKILANTVYSDSTLKSWKKEDLIEHIRILEHNWASAEESLNNQANYLQDKVVLSREEYEKLKGCENTIKRFSKISVTEAETENKALKEEIAIVLAQKRNIWKSYNQLKEELKQERKETAREIYQQLQGHGTTYVKKWIEERFGVEVHDGNN